MRRNLLLHSKSDTPLSPTVDSISFFVVVYFDAQLLVETQSVERLLVQKQGYGPMYKTLVNCYCVIHNKDCSCFGLLVSFLMGFKSSRVDLACTLSCLCVVIPKVTSGATPAFSTNRGVHYIRVYTAWQPSHFDPHTCSHQTYPQALMAPRSEPGLEPMAWAWAGTHNLLCCSTVHLTTRPFWFGLRLRLPYASPTKRP